MSAIVATVPLVAILGALGYIDARTRRLPDWLTLPLIALGFGVTWVLVPAHLGSHILAAAIGYLAFWSVATFYRRLRGYDGLGLGDAKLLAAVGAWLGPLSLAPVVLVASVSALATAGLLHFAGRPLSLQSSLPFGPFLGTGFLLLWGLQSFGMVPW